MNNPYKQMHAWPNHTIKIKSRKETIEIEIALIDKKSNYITRALADRLQQRGLASHSHERLYTSKANRRRGWMTSSKKRGNG